MVLFINFLIAAAMVLALAGITAFILVNVILGWFEKIRRQAPREVTTHAQGS
jgi:hypothetical protein